MGFEEFCGGEFWNSNLTWNIESHPDFTACFHKSVVSWTPAAVLLILCPFELRTYLKSPNRNIPWTFLNVLKLFFTVSLIAISLTELIYVAKEDHGKYPDIDYVTTVVYLVQYLLSLAMLILSIRYGIMSSPTQFIFYLLSTFCGGAILRSVIRRQDDPDMYMPADPTRLDRLSVLFGIQFSASVIMLVANCWADAKPKILESRVSSLTKPCPQIFASFFSGLIYAWMDRLLWTGYRRPLQNEDLWQMNPKYTSRGQVPIFDYHYEQEKIKARKQGRPFSVTPALIRAVGPTFFAGAALKLVQDVLAMISPQVMNLMMDYVASYEYFGEFIQPEWRGYLYAATMFLALELQSIVLSQYFERMFIVGMNLRTMLISTIYRKSLTMSGSAKKVSTIGETVNLMSVDVQKFMDLLPYLNMLWSAPLQIALCCYFIYDQLGNAMFSGVALMVLTLPLNGVIAGFTRKYQLEQMKQKDERVKTMNEILGGVKVLKLYGWEKSFIGQVLGIRSKEQVVLKKIAYMGAFINFIWMSIPFLVALISFTTYVFIDGGQVLTPDKAFVTLSYLNIMRMPMAVLPFMVIGLVQVQVSIKRINKFMNNEDLDPEAVTHEVDEKTPITVQNGTFRWEKEDTGFALSDVDMAIPKRSLTAVVGSVGAGKSSLVSALLGEMEKERGNVNLTGSVAYVPQQAWMQNATLQENIIFGSEHVPPTYESVIDACALRSDIAILPGGDQTEIGEKGINLSGGQKQRVSLARAVYSDADVYLLDDPLSAVDSHVGKHIFQEVIGHDGLLKDKTRLLVTHGITYLPKVDHIIVIKDGRISEQGSYQELVASRGAFAEFLLEYMADDPDAAEDEDLANIKHTLEETMGGEENFKREMARQVSRARTNSLTSSVDSIPVDEQPAMTEKPELQSQKSRPAELQSQKSKPEEEKKGEARPPSAGTKLIEKESAETGSVGWPVYRYYMGKAGTIGVIAVLLMQGVFQTATVGTSLWLNAWTSNKYGNASEDKYRNLYLGVYGAFGFAQALSIMILSIVLGLTTLNASSEMHKDMLNRVLRSPMSFFDTTPLGRIVNRFAKDVDVCDITLPANLRSWLNTFFGFLATVIVIMTVIPLFIAAIIPLALIFFFVQTVYVSTSRQLKRLESVSRSPIYSHFGESVQGASTIRAFGHQQRFITQSETKVDENQVCYYPSIMANRWLAVRLEFLGNVITFFAALFVILEPDALSAGDVGLVITYALNVTQMLTWLVRMTSDVETNIVAVERIKEYAKSISEEADWDHGENKPKKTWPEQGQVEFKDYGMRYREGLDLVVQNISVTVKGGETVGIVGRTGAGKSSLTVALFRLVEPAEGSIIIDGEDISKLALHDLRKKLTIIPQDPVLFSGTLRINLDPFSVHTDDEVWKALELAHLKTFASGLEAGLEHEVSEGGDNLSVGQRQLVCLARALLRKTKVLILDEATAAVDLETDDLIQETIRKEFRGCTVLTIAHRLNTILDYDKILVLDKGRIKEFDSPDRLLQNEQTVFYSMAKDAKLV